MGRVPTLLAAAVLAAGVGVYLLHHHEKQQRRATVKAQYEAHERNKQVEAAIAADPEL